MCIRDRPFERQCCEHPCSVEGCQFYCDEDADLRNLHGDLHPHACHEHRFHYGEPWTALRRARRSQQWLDESKTYEEMRAELKASGILRRSGNEERAPDSSPPADQPSDDTPEEELPPPTSAGELGEDHAARMRALAAEAARFHETLEEAVGYALPQRRQRVAGIPIRNNGDNHQDGTSTPVGSAAPEGILAMQFEGGPPLERPCVDCGLQTGNFCLSLIHISEPTRRS